ncbi:VOC family protein [Candidatus Leptofilum sp.]|uniref:VOC family protein n=1 Tax=Candidatus Leptofilum sp. TaxID=3241576 RepID=UPI003B59F583
MGSRVLQIAEVALKVDDLPAMVAFYQDVLGFEIHIARPHYVFLKVGELNSPLGKVGHPQILGLFDRQVALDVHLTTLDHLAFEVASEHFEEELARFSAKGMVIRERSWPDSLDWRARAFFFRDPEGNMIELIAANGNR